MAVNLSPVAGAAAQFFDNSGNVLTGGKLYTYLAGTTTPESTYTSSSGVTAQPNPIVLNAAGRVPDSGEIWLTDSISYKFILKDQNDVLIGTYDNLVGINSNFVNFTGEEETQTATQGQTVFTLATLSYLPATNNLLVFVNGSKQVLGANFTETSTTTVTFVDGLNVGDVVDFCTATPINTSVVTATQVSYTPGTNSLFTLQNNTQTALDAISDKITGANYVGYNEGGTGAVNRTVTNKLQDSISVKDFGAKGDGTTDDTAAFNAATAYALANGVGRIYIPDPVLGQGYKITATIACSNGTNAVKFIGAQNGTTRIWSYVTGTTPVFSFVGSPSGYYGAGVQSLSIIAKNAASDYSARNSGSAIKLSGTIGVIIDDVYIQDYTYGVWLYNATSLYTELTKLNIHTQYCSNALRMETASASWPSFRDTSGYMYSDIQVGQIGIALTSNVLWYNYVFNFDWTSHGAGSPQVINLNTASVIDGTLFLNGEVQDTSTPTVAISPSTNWKSQVFVATNGTLTNLPAGPGYGQILDNGRSYVAASSALSLAVGAATTVPNINGAMIVLRDGTGGGTATFLADGAGGGTITIIADPFSRIVTSDPGAGGNKYWVQIISGVLTITNRFTTSQTIDILVLGAN